MLGWGWRLVWCIGLRLSGVRMLVCLGRIGCVLSRRCGGMCVGVFDGGVGRGRGAWCWTGGGCFVWGAVGVVCGGGYCAGVGWAACG